MKTLSVGLTVEFIVGQSWEGTVWVNIVSKVKVSFDNERKIQPFAPKPL